MQWYTYNTTTLYSKRTHSDYAIFSFLAFDMRIYLSSRPFSPLGSSKGRPDWIAARSGQWAERPSEAGVSLTPRLTHSVLLREWWLASLPRLDPCSQTEWFLFSLAPSVSPPINHPRLCNLCVYCAHAFIRLRFQRIVYLFLLNNFI